MDTLTLAYKAIDKVATRLNQSADRKNLPPVFFGERLSDFYRLTPAPRLSFRGLTIWAKYLPTGAEVEARLNLFEVIGLFGT